MIAGSTSEIETIENHRFNFGIWSGSLAARAPFLMHLGEEDEFISKTAQAQIKAALAKKPNATVYSYPGQRHAFSRHNGAHYPRWRNTPRED